MKTPYLNKMIDDLQNHIESVESCSYAGIAETRSELAEYEAIKKALSINRVVGQSEQFICHKENIGHTRCMSACGKCGDG